MMGGRVGGLFPEHLFEVMKLTTWCAVGMITPICEKMMLVWVWGCQLERRREIQCAHCGVGGPAL